MEKGSKECEKETVGASTFHISRRLVRILNFLLRLLSTQRSRSFDNSTHSMYMYIFYNLISFSFSSLLQSSRRYIVNPTPLIFITSTCCLYITFNVLGFIFCWWIYFILFFFLLISIRIIMSSFGFISRLIL